VADPPEDAHGILLELHARPSADAEASAGEVAVDVCGRDGDTRGQALEDRDERGTVGLTGGQPTKHAVIIP
jgi:hypothetical protein